MRECGSNEIIVREAREDYFDSKQILQMVFHQNIVINTLAARGLEELRVKLLLKKIHS
jgi:hypothetical protein